ncbi:MAG: hypothetical protein ACK5HS_00510 [Mycoplasmatales bacterium]
MKKLLIGIISVLVILLVAINLIPEAEDLYENAPHFNYEDLMDHTSDHSFIYVYGPNCHFCEQIHPVMNTFYKDYGKQTNLQLINVEWQAQDGSTPNEAIKASDNLTEAGDTLTKYSDLLIGGTPSLIEVEDNKVLKVYIGADQVPEFTKEYASNHDKDPKE